MITNNAELCFNKGEVEKRKPKNCGSLGSGVNENENYTVPSEGIFTKVRNQEWCTDCCHFLCRTNPLQCPKAPPLPTSQTHTHTYSI